MSDRSSAWIYIGGPITEEGIKTLAEAIYNEGIGDDWDTRFKTEDEAEAHIRPAIEEGTSLHLFKNEVVGGYFGDLEATCRELDLTYRRGDNGHYAYSATAVFWQPGMIKLPDSLEVGSHAASNSDDEMLVGIASVIAVLDKEGPDGLAKWARVLQEHFLADIPPLTLAKATVPA